MRAHGAAVRLIEQEVGSTTAAKSESAIRAKASGSARLRRRAARQAVPGRRTATAGAPPPPRPRSRSGARAGRGRPPGRPRRRGPAPRRRWPPSGPTISVAAARRVRRAAALVEPSGSSSHRQISSPQRSGSGARSRSARRRISGTAARPLCWAASRATRCQRPSGGPAGRAAGARRCAR